MEFPTRRSIRMMTSVSMLPRMTGAAIAVSLVKGFGMLALQGPHVGDGARYRCRRRHRGARQMGTGLGPLAADEIAIRGRNRALAGSHRFAVGGEAHRASGLTPFETCVDEELVESFGHCFAFHRLRTRHDPGAHAGRNLAATRDRGRRAQITQPAI